VCLFGGGVIKADASDAARTFARSYGIPVTTTMPGIGSFPEDDDHLCLSWGGMHGTGYANMAITHTDCLIAVGTRFDDRLTGGIDTFARRPRSSTSTSTRRDFEERLRRLPADRRR